ncbi:MAG: hypothetical protein P8Y77_10655 [Nitrospirota bacterium]
MGATKSSRRAVSQIASDLLAKARGGGDTSLDIGLLREEILRDIEGRDEVFGKFQTILDALRDVVRDEDKLYPTALKMLSATAGISREDILASADARLSELDKMDEAFLSAFSDWRLDIKGMESRLLEIRGEISALRGKIGRLEEEERGVRGRMAERSREIKMAEAGIEGLISGIAAEISALKAKVESSVQKKESPRAAAEPLVEASYSLEAEAPAEAAAEAEVAPRGAPAPRDSGDRKKCSVCGCQAFWYEKERMWKCYVCANEEEEAGAKGAQGNGADTGEAAKGKAQKADPSPAKGYSIPQGFSSLQKTARTTKTCPICKKKMDWHDPQKTWRCPHCDYQRMAF